MKRIAIIALTFVLAGCIMTGCRRNNMQDTNSTHSTNSNTTVTTIPDVTILPEPSTRATESTFGTDPMDGSTGNEDVITRGRTIGPKR